MRGTSILAHYQLLWTERAWHYDTGDNQCDIHQEYSTQRKKKRQYQTNKTQLIIVSFNIIVLQQLMEMKCLTVAYLLQISWPPQHQEDSSPKWWRP